MNFVRGVGRIARMIVFSVLLGLAFIVSGCWEAEDRQAMLEREKKEREKHQEDLWQLYNQIASRYNAIYFPTKKLSEKLSEERRAFTYDFQKFFREINGKAVLFKGYLEDIEETNQGFIVEITCSLGRSFYESHQRIRFMLIASMNDVKNVLSNRRKETLSSSFLRYWDEPEFFVVATIDKISKYRLYEYNPEGEGEDVYVDPKASINLISTGQLIDIFEIPEKDDRSVKAK